MNEASLPCILMTPVGIGLSTGRVCRRHLQTERDRMDLFFATLCSRPEGSAAAGDGGQRCPVDDDHPSGASAATGQTFAESLFGAALIRKRMRRPQRPDREIGRSSAERPERRRSRRSSWQNRPGRALRISQKRCLWRKACRRSLERKGLYLLPRPPRSRRITRVEVPSRPARTQPECGLVLRHRTPCNPQGADRRAEGGPRASRSP